jgi:membrane fusion protein
MAITFRNIPALAGQTIATPLGLRGMDWSLVTAFLAGTVAVGVGFATVAGYARKETAIGFLAPEAGAARVAAVRPGILTRLEVANGTLVQAGDPLFTVDTRHALEGGGTLDNALHHALDRQAALLREQIGAEESRTASETARLDSRIQGLAAELASLAVQRALQAERAQVTEERLKALSDLRRKGFVSEAEFRAREESWLAQRQSLAAIDQRITAAQSERDQSVIQRDQLPADNADRLARLNATLADLERQRVEVIAQGAQQVRAPIAGRVTALQAAPGQRLDPAKPVLTLLPEGSTLRADLFVPSRAIGFVTPGQPVRLMYDAFPFQRFGAYGGVVDTVSETVLAPDEIIGPVRAQEPVYRVAVTLDRATVDAFGRAVPLQPDMTVTADIILEERSLLEWLLEPLLSARGRM